MKSHYYLTVLHRHLIFLTFVVLYLASCKKETLPVSRVTASEKSDVASDGIVSVQASILPPATQQSYVANGSSSKAVFQIVASQHVFLEGTASFNATYPFIQFVVPSLGFPFPNNGGSCSGDLVGDIYGPEGYSLVTQQYYQSVDSTTSGTVVHLNFQSLTYRTDDESYHTLYMGNKIKAQDMCLVNNLPHMLFQNPMFDTLKNGYTEIAQVKLTGDTNWVLNKLPLNFASFTAAVLKCKLIVKCKGNTITTKSDSVQVDYGWTGQTTIQFVGGFTHQAGNSEILKIYAAVAPRGGTPRILTTRLSPLDKLEWIDGLGKILPGSKNAKFFKEPTGQSQTNY